MDFTGKTAIVTGGCGGLGQAISLALLSAGANVVAVDINTSLIKTFKKTHESTYPSRVLAYESDITQEALLSDLFKAAEDRFGIIDVVVNNAGIMDRCDPVGALDQATWNKVMAVNLTAPFLVSKLAVQHMLVKKVKGSIVNVASAASLKGFVAGAAYTASKHGLIGLTKNTACFYGPQGIRCNAVLPAGMETNVGSAFANGYHEEGMVLMRKAFDLSAGMIDVKEVASAVLFLASDASGVVNGTVLPVDKGWAAF